jgi:hypothetical protein
MHVHLERWRRSMVRGHSPENISKLLVGSTCTKTTSSSESGAMSRHIPEFGVLDGGQSVVSFTSRLLVLVTVSNLLIVVDSEQLEG